MWPSCIYRKLKITQQKVMLVLLGQNWGQKYLGVSIVGWSNALEVIFCFCKKRWIILHIIFTIAKCISLCISLDLLWDTFIFCGLNPQICGENNSLRLFIPQPYGLIFRSMLINKCVLLLSYIFKRDICNNGFLSWKRCS